MLVYLYKKCTQQKKNIYGQDDVYCNLLHEVSDIKSIFRIACLELRYTTFEAMRDIG